MSALQCIRFITHLMDTYIHAITYSNLFEISRLFQVNICP